MTTDCARRTPSIGEFCCTISTVDGQTSTDLNAIGLEVTLVMCCRGRYFREMSRCGQKSTAEFSTSFQITLGNRWPRLSKEYCIDAVAIMRRFDAHWIIRADSRARPRTGKRMPISTA